jgi:hypothetical protein
MSTTDSVGSLIMCDHKMNTEMTPYYCSYCCYAVCRVCHLLLCVGAIKQTFIVTGFVGSRIRQSINSQTKARRSVMLRSVKLRVGSGDVDYRREARDVQVKRDLLFHICSNQHSITALSLDSV